MKSNFLIQERHERLKPKPKAQIVSQTNSILTLTLNLVFVSWDRITRTRLIINTTISAVNHFPLEYFEINLQHYKRT